MSLPLVLAAGAALRFVVPSVLPATTTVLAATAEVSTPIDSFRFLQEAFFYLDSGLDLYDGAMVHHPPLFVVLMKLVRDVLPTLAPFLFNGLFTVADVGTAYKLTQLNAWYNRRQAARTGLPIRGLRPELVAAFYLFNPLVVLTNWSHLLAVFANFLLVELLIQVLVDVNVFRAAMALAVASYLAIFPVYLIVPLVALAYANAPRPDWRLFYVKTPLVFVASCAALLLVSYALTLLPAFLYRCYGAVLSFEHISPNIGLWWYIFTEMFEFFASLYKAIFNLYNCVFVVPLTLRFFEPHHAKTGDLLLAFVLCHLWICFSKPYPIIGDLGFTISMFPIFNSTAVAHVKFLFLTGLIMISGLFLSPIFYYCWIILGNGNSNFFYSASLLWGAVHVLIFLDFIWGRLVFDYALDNDVGTAKLRLTQI